MNNIINNIMSQMELSTNQQRLLLLVVIGMSAICALTVLVSAEKDDDDDKKIEDFAEGNGFYKCFFYDTNLSNYQEYYNINATNDTKLCKDWSMFIPGDK